MAKPKRIILVRHGQSIGNADKTVFQHTADHSLYLTDKGIEQAQQAGKELYELLGESPIRAYISPYKRTRMTFENIKLGGPKLNVVKASEDPRIREQDFGHLRPIDAFELIDKERTAYGTFFYRIPNGGESGADTFDRVSGFLDTLWRDFEKPDYPENALIISHGLTIRLFCMRWFHWSVEQFEKLRNVMNCEKIILQLNDKTNKYELITPFREYTLEETASWKENSKTTATGGTKPWMH
jgi:broad specificity phosphatase PhoE